MVKRVLLVFEDSDHSRLLIMKKKYGYTWEQFILKLLDWEQYSPKWNVSNIEKDSNIN